MQILKKTESINWAIEALDDMPGIGRKSAERILAETGVEMEHFQNESRFSSWAGLVPECKESAGCGHKAGKCPQAKGGADFSINGARVPLNHLT